MKTVRIQAWQIGLVFKQGGYKRILSEGKHWFWLNETVHVFNRGERLQNAPCDLDVLLSYPDVAAALDIVEVKDPEIALQYEKGLFLSILPKGRWAYWKGIKQYDYQKADLRQIGIPATVDPVLLTAAPLSAYVRTFTIEAQEQGVLFIDWTFDRILKPGVYSWWKNSTPIHVAKVDTRQQQMEVSGQEILTKDKASLRFIDNNNRRKVAQFIAAHHLQIGLDGSSADAFVDSFVFKERFRYFFDQRIELVEIDMLLVIYDSVAICRPEVRILPLFRQCSSGGRATGKCRFESCYQRCKG